MPEKYQDEIEEILKGIEDTTPITPTRERDRPYRDDQEPIRTGPRAVQSTGPAARRLPSRRCHMQRQHQGKLGQ